eukprot:203462_1
MPTVTNSRHIYALLAVCLILESRSVQFESLIRIMDYRPINVHRTPPKLTICLWKPRPSHSQDTKCYESYDTHVHTTHISYDMDIIYPDMHARFMVCCYHLERFVLQLD